MDSLTGKAGLSDSSCGSRFTEMTRKRDKLPDSAIAQVVQMHKSESDLVRQQVLSDNKCLQTVAAIWMLTKIAHGTDRANGM